jgi:hypothetical protein
LKKRIIIISLVALLAVSGVVFVNANENVGTFRKYENMLEEQLLNNLLQN